MTVFDALNVSQQPLDDCLWPYLACALVNCQVSGAVGGRAGSHQRGTLRFRCQVLTPGMVRCYWAIPCEPVLCKEFAVVQALTAEVVNLPAVVAHFSSVHGVRLEQNIEGVVVSLSRFDFIHRVTIPVYNPTICSTVNELKILLSACQGWAPAVGVWAVVEDEARRSQDWFISRPSAINLFGLSNSVSLTRCSRGFAAQCCYDTGMQRIVTFKRIYTHKALTVAGSPAIGGSPQDRPRYHQPQFVLPPC